MLYIDLLVIENFLFNYIILYSVSIILNRITKFKQIFLASAIGNISLIFLFLDINIYLLNLITFLFIIIMSLISFDYKNIIYTVKNIMYVYFVGCLYFVSVNFLPKIDSYLLNAIIFICLAPITTYVYIKSLSEIKICNSNYYLLDIYLRDKPKITVVAFLDTGNKLDDPYSKKPIILISENIVDLKTEKVILVPYNTIDSHGLLPCFSPSKIYIHKIGYVKKVLIGIIKEVNIEGADCILNQKVLERII